MNNNLIRSFVRDGIDPEYHLDGKLIIEEFYKYEILYLHEYKV